MALETVEALARAEGRASQGGEARETQIARSIGAILARAGGKASVVARAGELPAAIEPEQQAAARGDVRFFERTPRRGAQQGDDVVGLQRRLVRGRGFQNDTSQAFDVEAP